jgi:hypothetical protein
MIKEPIGKKICATCGIDVGENDTELVNNYWSFLYRYKKVYRCPKCLKKRKIIIFTLSLLLILTFAYEIVISL